MNDRLTLVLGASENPERYSNKAIKRLLGKGEEVVAVGLREGGVEGIPIVKEFPDRKLHTITLYVGPANQSVYYDRIIDARPERVIFNPGTENPELFELLEKNGIKYVTACTLVMLSVGNY